jgi:two-component system, OmpR family, sensor histidine kinase SenX3
MAQDEISFTDLIASSIHDMKNSLNLQVSALEGIARQSREQGNNALFQDLGRVIYQANRMNLNLVELLSLYKLSKSIYPMDITEQAVAEVIEEAVMQNQSMMDFKGIVVSVDCAPDCHWYMDRELVKGVLVNALNNAYHYTTDKIHILAVQKDKRLELRVEDNGQGYPARMLINPDLGADQGVSFESGSTGLGFYFSDQVARLHKNAGQRGALAIENGGSLGGGCFVLRLP